MNQTVQIDTNPHFASSELVGVLAHHGYRASLVGSDSDDGCTLRIDNPGAALDRRILEALDDLIARSGLPLLSRRIDGGRFVVHPAAG
jgi:hypothetical protein